MKDDVWKSMNAHAFTTGRPRVNPNTFGKKIPPAVRPKSQTLKQPGKINLIESNAQGNLYKKNDDFDNPNINK